MGGRDHRNAQRRLYRSKMSAMLMIPRETPKGDQKAAQGLMAHDFWILGLGSIAGAWNKARHFVCASFLFLFD
jgi:hypothetical protein